MFFYFSLFICFHLLIQKRPGACLHLQLDWNDARYVSDYVKDKAAAEGLSLEQWALQYHAKRGTVSGRMGLSRSEEAAKLKALP